MSTFLKVHGCFGVIFVPVHGDAATYTHLANLASLLLLLSARRAFVFEWAPLSQGVTMGTPPLLVYPGGHVVDLIEVRFSATVAVIAN